MSLFFLLTAVILHSNIQPFDQARIVLLFGNKTVVNQQWQVLQQDSAGLAERDLQIERVEPVSSLYKTYAVSAGESFTIILVGKDGGEKYRSNKITTTTQLFALIDGMPMRQAEMRQKKKNEPR